MSNPKEWKSRRQSEFVGGLIMSRFRDETPFVAQLNYCFKAINRRVIFQRLTHALPKMG